MKQAACHAVQESVASGVRLSPAGQRHLEECVSCQKVLDEYHQLEALFTFHDVVIPDGFADGVMARIGNASPCRADWFVSMQIRLATLAVRPIAQWLLLSFALFMSVMNFMRLVLFLLTPAY